MAPPTGKAPHRIAARVGIGEPPAALRRVVVVGTSGSGKSTFARALAQALRLPCVELDAHFWGPGWTPRDPEPFRHRIADLAAGEGWVVDGNYGVVRSVLWPRATDVVWLNYGRVTVFSRILWRTVRRVATQEPLWSGNRESLRKAFGSKDSILLWSISTYAKNRAKYPALRADPAWAHLRWHEFRLPREARRFLRSVAPGA
jgi:adenylate kinase family enzyme